MPDVPGHGAEGLGAEVVGKHRVSPGDLQGVADGPQARGCQGLQDLQSWLEQGRVKVTWKKETVGNSEEQGRMVYANHHYHGRVGNSEEINLNLPNC